MIDGVNRCTKCGKPYYNYWPYSNLKASCQCDFHDTSAESNGYKLDITVQLGDALEVHAKLLNKTAEQLTPIEKMQALLSAVLKAGDDS